MKMAESSPKQVENTVGKGEIARYEQFLLFSQCFQNKLNGRHIKTRERVKLWEQGEIAHIG